MSRATAPLGGHTLSPGSGVRVARRNLAADTTPTGVLVPAVKLAGDKARERILLAPRETAGTLRRLCDEAVFLAEPAQVKGLQGTDGIKVEEIPGLGYAHMTFNMTKPDLAKKEVRQALAYAVDYDAIRTVVLQGQGVSTGSSPIARDGAGWRRCAWPIPPPPRRARTSPPC